jgi:hypothetical protein
VRQWQAQEPPHPPEAVGADESVLVAELSLGLELSALFDSVPLDVASELGAGVEVAGVPPLKSVAYQPDPFNWNPAAVTCFLKVDEPQLGQSLRGASDIFCNTSLANPQDSHL